ncbi:MAG: TfoX/Sxy family protein [Cyclobacteriaceae bacterium]
MATDPYLLDRLRQALKNRNVIWQEKKMFGGDCFMVEDKMCFGTFLNGLMVRVGHDAVDESIQRLGASQMMQKERPMKGYLFIEPEGYDTDEDLTYWVDKCLAFNPLANASKKK